MDAQKIKEKLENEEDNEDYIGNIWGWKFSLIGLIFILLTGGIMYYGQTSGKVDYFSEPEPQTAPVVDSTLSK